jgi:hypothetical protein
MKHTFKLIGIISIALIIVFSFAACDDGSTGGGGSGGGGGGGRGGTFTITDIPSKYNGTYANLTSVGSGLYGGQIDKYGVSLSGVLISNGRVSLPMWKENSSIVDLKRYSGNDTNVSLQINIYLSQIPNNPGTERMAMLTFYSNQDRAVNFSNGSATRSWSQGYLAIEK